MGNVGAPSTASGREPWSRGLSRALAPAAPRRGADALEVVTQWQTSGSQIHTHSGLCVCGIVRFSFV